MAKSKALLLVPDLKGDGGVTNLYNTLELEKVIELDYFAVNKPTQQNAFSTAKRLLKNYCSYTYSILKYNYNLIHVNPSLNPRSFYRDAIFIIIAKLLDKNVLVTFHGWLDEFEQKIKYSSTKSLLFKISYARADKYIVLGEVFKRKLLQMGVSPHKNFHIETTVADSSFIEELDLNKKTDSFKHKIVFLFLSKVARTKGIYIALDAYKEFSEKHPAKPCCFIVAGDGPELGEVKRHVAEKGIPNVTFTGHVTGKEKKKLLLESHIMFLRSYTEGLPNSILEGMLYGMPIISRATGGIPDVIKNDINGFISDSFNPSVYTNFIASLEQEPQKYQRIAFENIRVAKLKYTTEIVREKVWMIYKTL